jgi:type II secretory pathway pseudopilin PulG
LSNIGDYPITFERWDSRKAFTLVETLVAVLIMMVALSALYFLYISGIRRTETGAGKLRAYHRLRMVTEIIKDDIREAAVLPDTVDESYLQELIFEKFVASPLMDEDSTQVTPLTRKVVYRFDEAEKRLTGSYGGMGSLVDTQLLESVGFRMMILGGKPFLRMKFEVLKDPSRPDKGKLSLYHTVGSRFVHSRLSQPFWHSLQETRPIPE